MSWRGLLLKREFFQEKTKNILSILAVMLGVALIVATSTTISSTKQEFFKMAAEGSSGADLIVTSVADQKVSNAILNYKDSSIKDSVPFFSEDSYYQKAGSYHTLTLMAADFGREAEYGGYKLLKGKLPENGECLITENMESLFQLKTGDKMLIRTNRGSFTYCISGIVQDAGIATGNFCQCILTDIRHYNEYGTMTYKLMLKSGTDVKKEKALLQKALNGSYTVDYPAGKAEEFLNQASSLFDVMLGFGLLTLLLGGFLINVTVNEFVRRMRGKNSILKVLGAKGTSITGLILEKSLITGCIGTALGIALGAFGSLGLIRLVDNSFSGGGMTIRVSFPLTGIGAVAISAVLLCLLTSLPASRRAARESIVSGFRQYDRKNAVGLKRKLAAGVLFAFLVVLRILLGSSSLGKLVTFVALAAGIYFAALVFFLPFVRLTLKPVNRISPFNGFTVKNNLFKQSGKAINLAVLFSFVIAISTGVYLIVSEIGDAIERMERGFYYGDAIVSSVTGKSIDSDTLQKIGEAKGVDRAYPIYQKYLKLGSDNVQMKGYRLDDTTLKNFSEYWEIGRDTARKLSDKNTMILSKKAANDLGLKEGDTVTVDTGTGMQTFKIVGTYETLNNNGMTGIISEDAFLSTFENYTIRAVNVFKKSDADFDSLKAGIARSVNDSFIQVLSMDAMRNAEQKSDGQFLSLIDCMIVVLVMAGILILVNSISMNIKNNGYSLAVTKLLGAAKWDLMLQSGIEGILYGIFGIVVGEASGVMLGWIMTKGMNNMVGWNLRFAVSPYILLAFGAGFLCMAVLAEIMATALNYRYVFKSGLRVQL
ncbi:ABC transporter permease [Ruminiclostridium cellobioparum]|uniref:Putative ABC-type transport system involved in lysophospholipase L1 biosynthesis, permease component n=1 Tax=Ruminiclostridium cellobioparum subsp. termitidis CT1112 TaxID=1195236 RepID=S0FKA4_RUMCE|nr:FtsX-like permease family protein [Ruminiclostridium cellobioparum]EMS69609.1 putative ABC-type transport system involved in lysophospholipase L1 biosynthesis, permease component [Ruminiclostridium cellobioparum subsp. termitidis CT1112]